MTGTPELESELHAIESQIAGAFAGIENEHALRHARATILGPDGSLTALLKKLPSLPKEARPAFGKRGNEVKRKVESTFEKALSDLADLALRRELEGPPLDITAPGRSQHIGALHPLSSTAYELLDTMSSLGFRVADGPEVERYDYNFDKLGFPPDHPATDMQDSFFLDSRGEDGRRHLLRTHTSTVQVREMLRKPPPLAVVSTGAVYRRDSDVTHSPMFFQLEGLYVDKGVRFSDLKGTLELLIKRVFGANVPMRLRPSYFPFVEPGAEVDIGWKKRKDGSWEWMEILGCGMVHPVVFEHVGYDPELYSGFAFGIGIDRVAMLKHGIKDIRLLYGNDQRFLEQF